MMTAAAARSFRDMVCLDRILITAVILRKGSGASSQLPKMDTLYIPVTTVVARFGSGVFHSDRPHCPVGLKYRVYCADIFNGHKSAIRELASASKLIGKIEEFRFHLKQIILNTVTSFFNERSEVSRRFGGTGYWAAESYGRR